MPGVVYEENLYEGYGAGGVGFVVEVTTDNKIVSFKYEVQYKNGGNLAGVGAVAFQFDRKGQFIIEASAIDEEGLMEIALDAGADDIKNEEDHYEVLCAIADFDNVSQSLAAKEIPCISSGLVYLPKTDLLYY